MSNIEQDIPKWLRQQKDWLQKVVAESLASGQLTYSDIQAIAERLKTPDGQQLPTQCTFDGMEKIVESRTKIHLQSIAGNLPV